jgi:phage terminase large subunit-like protein
MATKWGVVDRKAYYDSLTPPQRIRLKYNLKWNWNWLARPSQLQPTDVDHIVWLILAGRGFGKTRAGAEKVREWVKTNAYVNLIGATASDARDIMIEGESGILAICPNHERPVYRKSECKLIWPNGAVSLTFSAEEPERLRGKQSCKLWCDELASWRYPDSWDQAMFGLRLGDNPQAVVTTTPKPTALVKTLIKSPTTVITRGSTFDNAQNLARTFLSKVLEKYEGTRLGRQEIYAQVLEDNPGALWKRSQIDAARISPSKLPHLTKIVVGVDPAATGKETSDYTGIVVVGRDQQSPPHFYILADTSVQALPDGWGKRVIQTLDESDADEIIGETNQGGDMVEFVIRTQRSAVRFRGVHASRGKKTRAEPVSALYEQGRVHHVGAFPQLEDEMCLVAGTMIETDRGSIPIESVIRGDRVLTRSGFAPVAWAGKTGETTTLVDVIYSHGVVSSTPCHPIFDQSLASFVSAKSVWAGSILRVLPGQGDSVPPSRGVAGGSTEPNPGTSSTHAANSCTGSSGQRIMGESPVGCTFTTETEIQATTESRTSNSSARKSMSHPTRRVALLRSRRKSVRGPGKRGGRIACLVRLSASSAAPGLNLSGCGRGFARVLAVVHRVVEATIVYNLSVVPGHLPEFFANGVLVHNCDWNPEVDDKSPDRMDAMVWGMFGCGAVGDAVGFHFSGDDEEEQGHGWPTG